FQDWFDEGIVPRDFYYKLADLGLFGISVPEEYGGAGLEAHKFAAIQSEELARAVVTFGGSNVHVGLVLPYLQALATTEQKERYFPKFVSGEEIWAIALTRPGTGAGRAGAETTRTPAPH